MTTVDLALPPKPANTRYQSLDLWRGAACLMLVLYHATFYADSQFRLTDSTTWSWAGMPLWLIRYCWAGVPIFFVISGYCIAASIDSLRRRPHSLRDYFIRRFRRIYPPLWIMCGCAVLFTLLVSLIPAISQACLQLPKLAEMDLWQWAGNLVAAESWRHNLVGGEPAYLMQNTWTLCYEEQFYLVAGIMLACSRRRFFLATGLVTLAVVVLRESLRLFGVTQQGFFWDGHWIMFAAGILVYHSLNYQAAAQRGWVFALFAVGMVYGAADRFLSHGEFERHLGECICVACAFAIGLICVRRWDDLVTRLAIMTPLRWCGLRSYSIYLTHYLLVVVVSCSLALLGVRSEWHVALISVPVCLALSLPVAVVYFRLVESRFLNSPVDSTATKPRVPATSCVPAEPRVAPNAVPAPAPELSSKPPVIITPLTTSDSSPVPIR